MCVLFLTVGVHHNVTYSMRQAEFLAAVKHQNLQNQVDQYNQ